MARIPMVTRSFETMQIVAMVVDTETTKIYYKECTLSRVITEQDKLEKAVKKEVETETIKFVTITAKRVETKLFGMLESDFLKYAKELDPETRKLLESEEQ